MAAQQLIASLGPLAPGRISCVAPNAVVTLFPSFHIVALGRFPQSRHSSIPAAIASRR
ncbi:hypothetical protein EMIT0158MI4_120194 [Burkholderia ambifaria]